MSYSRMAIQEATGRKKKKKNNTARNLAVAGGAALGLGGGAAAGYMAQKAAEKSPQFQKFYSDAGVKAGEDIVLKALERQAAGQTIDQIGAGTKQDTLAAMQRLGRRYKMGKYGRIGGGAALGLATGAGVAGLGYLGYKALKGRKKKKK